jgi:CubicO group peptidase (beta-lactamase class C family)
MACSANDPAPENTPPLYFPPVSGTAWETTTPATIGWNESNLDELYAFLEEKNTRAFIVLKNGKIVVEKYFGKQFDGTTNFSANSNWYWASAGKTLTAALVGIAEGKNLLELDEKSSDYLGIGWTQLTPMQERVITIRNQLTMTSGLDDTVVNPDCTEPACLVYKAASGTRWAYHNAPYTLLDEVLARATGKAINTFASEEILTKIGMNGLYLENGYNNVFYSTARSMARFGLLLLAKGNWDGTQVIPEDYVALMTSTSQNINLSYGYLTWLNGKASSMVPGTQLVFNMPIAPNAPTDMFAALGKNGQIISVVPSQNLVVIRMGDVPDSSLVPFTFHNELWAALQIVLR